MTTPAAATTNIEDPSEKIIVALDVSTADEARDIIAELSGKVGAYKIGLQLFVSAGPEFVREVAAENKVFLDLKFHDIPNTVANAAVEAAKLGVWMTNVHAIGGLDMMRSTVEAVDRQCEEQGIERPLLIAVTVLTSSDANVLNETGIESSVDEQVMRLAKLTKAAGFDGVVASAREAAIIRQEIGEDFVIVTPGIRAKDATNDDQRRVMTFSDAMKNGSTYAVIGRPITGQADRVAAVSAIIG
ncbi:MAG TPA: orotidine-5'-phosphate decarboxylase [Pyrinomonadaceae bacterium]|nr:orotidine-5'-phosphate decarboxylase [Pyrinomonadaceae bacterium]